MWLVATILHNFALQLWFSNFIMPQSHPEGLWKQSVRLYSWLFEFVVWNESQEFAFLKSFQVMPTLLVGPVCKFENHCPRQLKPFCLLNGPSTYVYACIGFCLWPHSTLLYTHLHDYRLLHKSSITRKQRLSLFHICKN